MAATSKALLACLGLFLGASGFVFSADTPLPPADAALADTFTLQGLTAVQPRRPDGGYDWDWRGPRDDPEWSWFFNRHAWFPDLLIAYQNTGDTRYEKALLDTLDDWIVSHPPPDRITFSAAWRPLEAARRLVDSWLPVMPALQNSPLFTAERRARYRSSLVGHGDHLRNHHAFGGNHLVTEMLALVELSLREPDLPGASDWLAYGLDQLDRAYDDQVYPDGSYKELATLYQRVVALNYHKLLQLLRTYHSDDEATKWAPRVDRLWNYIAAVRQPDGTNPINNDSDRENFTDLLLANVPEIARLNLVADTHFPWAGQTAFRTGDHWAFFDAGPRGSAHDHDDVLQLSLSVGTAHFLVDNGRYTYAPGPWRDYFCGPTGHNVLLLDGRGSDPGPREITAVPVPPRYHAAGPFTLAWGDTVFTSPGTMRAGDWRRIVIHAGSSGWVVVDRVVTFGKRTLTTQWHWAPAVAVAGSTPVSLSVQNQSEPLAVALSTPRPGAWDFIRGSKPPDAVQGWFSPRFNVREPALCSLYTQHISGPVTNTWIFQPAGTAPITLGHDSTGRLTVTTESNQLAIDPETPAGAVWIR